MGCEGHRDVAARALFMEGWDENLSPANEVQQSDAVGMLLCMVMFARWSCGRVGGQCRL